MNYELNINSGFLIVQTFPSLYRDYVRRYNLSRDFYAIPRIDKQPEDYEIQYRGLDRDALSPYDESEILAEVRMAEMETAGNCGKHGLLLSLKGGSRGI